MTTARFIKAGVCLLLIGLVSLPLLVNAATITGKVIKVVDGDTIDVLQNRQPVRIRLNGIDAPEKGQAFGKKAKEFVSGSAAQKEVTVEIVDRDRYGRFVGNVILPDARILNREIVKAGYAWWYRKYSKDQVLSQLEVEARRARRGLWQDKNPVPPWEWRMLKREGRGGLKSNVPLIQRI